VLVSKAIGGDPLMFIFLSETHTPLRNSCSFCFGVYFWFWSSFSFVFSHCRRAQISPITRISSETVLHSESCSPRSHFSSMKAKPVLEITISPGHLDQIKVAIINSPTRKPKSATNC